MVLGLEQLDAVMKVFGLLQRQLELSAFEYFSAACLKHVVNKGVKPPFEHASAHYVLIEYDEYSAATTESVLRLVEQCMEAGWVSDGVLSESSQQAQAFSTES